MDAKRASLFAPDKFSIIFSDPGLKCQFLSILRGKILNPFDGGRSILVNSREYKLFLDAPDPTTLLLMFASTSAVPTVNAGNRPVVIVRLDGNERPPTVDGNLAMFSYSSLTLPVLQSVLAYAAIFNDCFPFGFHRHRDLSPLAVNCLHRVFRSLDTDYDLRVSLSDLSRLNTAAFGRRLSGLDFDSIFAILNGGGGPAFADFQRTYTITFEQFLEIAEYLVCHDYGHVIFQFIAKSPFHMYLAELSPFAFAGTPKREVSVHCKQFIAKLYGDFDGIPSQDEIAEMFELQGGPPMRLSNVRFVSAEEWDRVWTEWCAINPEQAAKHLLAFGFPPEMIGEAFGVEEEAEKHGFGMTAVIGGLSAIFMGGLFAFWKWLGRG
jgi:hypothetical protein